MTEETGRRLAAILAADVVGYSRLIGIDEEGTVAAFRAHRAELIEGEIERYSGRVVNTAGDSLLIEFSSAVDAVRCALSVQKGMAARNEAIAPEQRITFRIGINVGDVVIDGDDILGDGVNIAARLEGICRPGGIVLSANVYDYVEGRIDESFVDNGECTLKNIARPLRTYSWQFAKQPEVAVPSPSKRAGRRPTVALTPLDAVGRGEDAQVLAATVTSAVSSALSNQTGLTLVTDLAQADYLAKGSIQARDGRYRATVQLFDQRSSEQFASDRFDGKIDNLFAAEEELAFRISTAVRFAIYPRNIERASGEEVDKDAIETILAKAGYLLLNESRADWRTALELADAVATRESNNSMAYAIKAVAHLVEVVSGVRAVPTQDGEAAFAAAKRAVELQEHSDFAHHAKAMVHLFYKRDLDAARRECERALELNPYYPFSMAILGLTLIFLDDAERGTRLCTKVVEANPRLPNNRRFMRSISYGHFVEERYDDAIYWAQRSDQLAANVPPTLLSLTAAASHAGECELAAATVDRLMASDPDLTSADLWRLPFRKEAHWSRFIEGLTKAGLPD
ncbi:MAG: adenylate/guanylate cyclase domain-containing protein [Hyphomicrobiaceae bacterium]